MSPRTFASAAVLVFIFFITPDVFLGVSLRGEAISPQSQNYSDCIEKAKAFSTEKSWALARDAYVAGLPFAPDDEARRWCQLWIADATWRAAATGQDDWQARRKRDGEYAEALDVLLAVYNTESGRAKDDFWVEAMISKTRALVPIEARPLRIAVAEYLGQLSPSRQSAARLLEFIRSVATRYSEESIPGDDDWFISLLDQASRLDQLSDVDRAWCAIFAAIGCEDSHMFSENEKQTRWTSAVDLARTTPLLPVAEARQFVFRSVRGSAPRSAEASNTPADFSELLRQLKAHRAAVARAPEDALTVRTHALLNGFETWWSTPLLILEAPDYVSAGEPLRFNYAAANVSGITVSLYKFPLGAKRTTGTSDYYRARIPVSAERFTDWTNGGALVYERTPEESASNDPKPGNAWISRSEEIPALEPGFYSLGLSGVTKDGRPDLRVINFVVTDIRAYLIIPETGNAVVHVFHGTSGAPVAGIRIRGMDTDERAFESLSPTDEDGKAELPPFNRGEKFFITDITMEAGGQPLSFNELNIPDSRSYSSRSQAQKTQIWADLFFDRSVYRPGETVRWKIVVRERSDGRFVPTAKKFRFDVEIDGDDLITDQLLTLTANGTAHGEIALPVTARPGSAHVSMHLEKDEKSFVTFAREKSFRVDNFQPPPITTSLRLANPEAGVKPGGDLALNVSAQYFSGGPVVGAPVHMTVTIPYMPTPNQDSRGRYTAEDWTISLAGKTLTATTGSNGEAVCHFKIPSGIPARTRINVTAAVRPEGTAGVDKTITVLIGGAGAFVRSVSAERSLVKPGDPTSFTLAVADSSGMPCAFSGTARVVELRHRELWMKPDGGIASEAEARAARVFSRWGGGSKMPESWKQLHKGDIVTQESTMPVHSGTDGRVRVPFTASREGRYSVRLEKNGIELSLWQNAEWEVEKNAEILVADAATTDLAIAPDATCVAGFEAWRDGEPLSVFIALRTGVRRAVLIIAAEQEIISKQIVTTNGRASSVNFERVPKSFGAINVTLSDLETGMPLYIKQFVIPKTQNVLSVQIAPSAESVRPGETSNVVLKIGDGKNQFANAELAVSVTDEAVNRLDASSAFLNVSALFAGAFSTANAQGGVSATNGLYRGPRKIRDFRPGALMNPTSRRFLTKQEIIEADVFEAMLDDDDWPIGYAASSMRAAGTSLTLRQHFASTAFWAPEVMTDAKGEARVSFKYPDNLTQWRISAYAVGSDGNTFGIGEAFTRTTLPFQARLQMPRFLIEGDRSSPFGVFVNRTDAALTAMPVFKPEGCVAFPHGDNIGQREIPIPAQGETRTSWTVRALDAGEAGITLTARVSGTNSVTEGDAMKLTIPVHEDGIMQEITAGTRLAPGADIATLAFNLPAQLDPERLQASVRLSATPASALIDALPYLINYPHGCTEQTMSRFLPAVVVKKTITDFRLDASLLERRILGKKSGGPARLDDVISSSLARLSQAQIDREGFGWWPGGDTADLWMTAYVAWGLAIARDAGVAVPETLRASTNEALQNLVNSIGREKNPALDDRVAWALAALAQTNLNFSAKDKDASRLDDLRAVFSKTFAAREKLSAAGRASLLLAANLFGTSEQRDVLLRNIENGAQRASSADLGETVYWGSTGGYWRAMDGAGESTALTVLALLQIDPNHALVEPAINWLVLNRRGVRWQSTRDTAFSVIALSRFLARQRDIMHSAGAEIEIVLNGKSLQRVVLNADEILSGPSVVTLGAAQLRAGENRVELRRRSADGKIRNIKKMPMFATVAASAWARGDSVKPEGFGAQITREFIRQKAEPTLLGTLRIVPQKLSADTTAQDAARAGEQVTASVTFTTESELEYVMITVPKPAGCEPINPLSGRDARLIRVGSAGENLRDENDEAIYREEHDDKSVFFLDHVEAGAWEIRYAMRAVFSGDYRALPVKIEAMYVPEIRANSDSRRVRIE